MTSKAKKHTEVDVNSDGEDDYLEEVAQKVASDSKPKKSSGKRNGQETNVWDLNLRK